MASKIRITLHRIYNILRIMISLLFIYIIASDLYEIFLDPVTYEAVYTGAFLGKNKFKTLYHLILSDCIEIVAFLIYLFISILHFYSLKNKKLISCILIIWDIIAISYFLCYLKAIYNL